LVATEIQTESKQAEMFTYTRSAQHKDGGRVKGIKEGEQ
jgi:hypothetical protein